jgi:SAM-dependent methyltransferase
VAVAGPAWGERGIVSDRERDHLEDNRRLWDAWTDVHLAAPFYDAERFLHDPSDVRIGEWEREEVGDVRGRDLLHVQCHFGLDTLSWARLGAVVTGVDFSPRAIAAARALAERAGIPARFVEASVYDLPAVLDDRFDVVYTSRGALGWLPSIERWAEVVASFVRPGGVLYVHEIHPTIQALDDESDGPIDLRYDYWEGDVLTFPVEGSYADPSAKVDADVEHGWNHGLGEIVTAIATRGLRIDFLHEHRWLDWSLPFLEQAPDGSYTWPASQAGSLPLMFSLKATRPN